MMADDPTVGIELRRDCEAVAIPSGRRQVLGKGTPVRIVQERGGRYNIATLNHAMYRIEAKDADALGIETASDQDSSGAQALSEQLVLDTLKTVRDPELPVNIVELGLIYSCEITANEAGRKTVNIRMAMTSPGCSMSEVLRSEVESKLLRLPEVSQAHVEVVFDPPWTPERMSDSARLQIGMEVRNTSGLVGISQEH